MRHAHRMAFTACWAILALAATGTAHAEWAQQEITLRPGWNAVYLTVKPDPADCEAVFGDLPIASVWTWNKRFSPVQFVEDPTNLVPEQPDWLTWFPEDSFNAFLSSLFAVQANKAYLILYSGDESTTFTVHGRAAAGPPEYLSDSFNLTGFPVDPKTEPSMAAYFAPSKAFAGQPIYRMAQDGLWEEVTDPATTPIEAGEAYLIKCKGQSTYAGPVKVVPETPNALNYGLRLSKLSLMVKNESTETKEIKFKLRPSARAADVVDPELGGDVPLYYKALTAWAPVSDDTTLVMGPKTEKNVELGVKRAEMPESASPNAQFESVLEVSDGEGTLINVPILANRTVDEAGLWVGLVTLNEVSEAGNAFDPETTTPTPAPFRFRMILHRGEGDFEGEADTDGPKVRLLQHVTVMQVQERELPDPDNPLETITIPSRFVLLSDDSLIPEYEGIAMRDGQIVGRRISSPMYSFDEPVFLDEDSSDPDVFRGSYFLPYDDPLNPFFHRYHPDHDNLNGSFTGDLGAGFESYDITRTITLEFSDEDPENLGELAYGYDLIGGTYTETISGLHRRDIVVQGRFRLNRISDVAVLNDGR